MRCMMFGVFWCVCVAYGCVVDVGCWWLGVGGCLVCVACVYVCVCCVFVCVTWWCGV